MNTARRALGAAGDSTAGLAIAGTGDPPTYALVEAYNGTTWTEVNDVNTAAEALGAAGTQSSALKFGGDPKPANEQKE